MDANSGANVGIILAVAAVLGIGYYVWVSLALAKVFEKLGEQGWKAWVPIINTITILEQGGYAALWVIAFFLPVVNVAALVICVLAINGINRRLGKGGGFTALAVLVYPVWVSILAFGPGTGAGTGMAPVSVAPGAPPSRLPQPAFTPAPATFGVGFPPPAPATPADAHAPVPFAAPAAAPAAPSPWGPPAVTVSAPVAPAAAPAVAAPVAAAPVAPPVAFITMPPSMVPATAAAPIAAVPATAPVQRPAVVNAPPIAPAPASGDLGAGLGHNFGADFGDDTDDDADDDAEKTMISSRRLKSWIFETETGQRVHLTSPVVLVGRNPAASHTHPDAQIIALSDPGKTVSKAHARLELADGAWSIVDLNSTNGVVLIDEVGTETELIDGTLTVLTERFLLGELSSRLFLDA